MRWNVGRLGRKFRRIFSLLIYLQLASPLVAVLSILVASVLGINSQETSLATTVQLGTISTTTAPLISLSEESILETTSLVDKEDITTTSGAENEDLDSSGGVSPGTGGANLSQAAAEGTDSPGGGEPLASCCDMPRLRPCPLYSSGRRSANSEFCQRDMLYRRLRLEADGLSDSLLPCSNLSLSCLNCTCDYGCRYGAVSHANCSVIAGMECSGPREFSKEFTCSYCYLSPSESHLCSTALATSCKATAPPSQRSHWYIANCTSSPEVLCLGSPVFSKRLECNWTEGYSWRTALFLSVTLGGFGADRFYLGHWQEGIGKLFSFGGLGVWTLVDVVLVAIGYIGPADGSLYV